MDKEVIAQLKLECLRLVVENHKGENRSADFILQKSKDLFDWVMGLNTLNDG